MVNSTIKLCKTNNMNIKLNTDQVKHHMLI